jgi:hypothetical protein
MSQEKRILGVASMFYKDDKHSHPVRRKVLVIGETAETLTGMELREGNVVRSYREARQRIVTYDKNKIARFGDYSRLKKAKRNRNRSDDESTLERMDFRTLITEGV